MMPVNKLLLEFHEESAELAHTYPGRIRLNYEPKKQNRFLVTFPKEIGDLRAFCVSSVSRPSWSNPNGWDDISIKLIDLIRPSTSRTLFDFLRWANEEDNKDRGLEFTIELIDPTGFLVERWEILALVSRIDFEELSYDKDHPAMIRMVISPIDINLPHL